MESVEDVDWKFICEYIGIGMDSFVVWLLTRLLSNVEPHYGNKLYGTSERVPRNTSRADQ